MRFTIERIRILVVAAAVLLLVALGIFLAKAKLRNRFTRRDLPHHLSKEIQNEANDFTFTHAFGAHSQYKIHASKEVQLRDNRVMLHDVQIELFGEDGSRVDQIAGDEFEYDQKSGLAIAVGPVEMDLTQPADTAHAAGKPGARPNENAAPPKQIHVKTSGVTFDQDSGQVTTVQRVDFSMTAGSGSSMGATYDSQNGYLTLERAVELDTERDGNEVKIHAQHAEFDRGAQTCWLREAAADERGARATAAQATILFREDGTAEKLDAKGGFLLATASGGRVAAPTATIDFDSQSQPRQGHLEGGVSMDSQRAGDAANPGRTLHGAAPTAELEFADKGELRHAHLERGVEFTERQGTSEQGNKGTSQQGTEKPADGAGEAVSMVRTWHSPVADVDFRDAGNGQVEPANLHGTGGVTITSENRRGSESITPAKMSADDVTGAFGPNSTLRSMTGSGHAAMDQTTANGTRQTANGDRIQATFVPPDTAQNRDQTTPASRDRSPGTPAGDKGAREQQSRERASEGAKEQTGGGGGTAAVQSAELDGHVTLFEQPAAKSGQAQPPIRATAGKAVYEGAGEWLHLTGDSRSEPRVDNGGLELTAEKVDVSQESGDAFAHGDVKATWSGGPPGGLPGRAGSRGGDDPRQGAMAFGGNGPAHVIASEAQLNESTGEATFRGHARLWQQANSVTAPVIVLNQHLQTLVARTTNPGEPVRAVLLSAGGPPGTGAGINAGRTQGQSGNEGANRKTAMPSVIRVRGGDLWYSDAEHRALMHGGVAGTVTAETSEATSVSDELELRLMPAGASGGQTQVDRMTAKGHVVLTSQGRRGTGEQLEYSGVTGDYVLTGTAAAPPRMSDPQQGNVTGQALIFHSRDDSVSIEGGGHETKTETTAPEAHGK
jgi:lipopolysaccharide export system protein LptA